MCNMLPGLPGVTHLQALPHSWHRRPDRGCGQKAVAASACVHFIVSETNAHLVGWSGGRRRGCIAAIARVRGGRLPIARLLLAVARLLLPVAPLVAVLPC